MKKLTLLVFLAFSMLLLNAQNLKYSRVRIYTGIEGVRNLVSQGVPADEGEFRPGAWVTCEISEAELAIVAREGYSYEVLIDDVGKYYAARAAQEMANLDLIMQKDYTLSREWEVPAGFALGSVGGFCSMDEMMEHLNTMVATYPDLVSPIYQMDSLTAEGRPIYWLRLSDNPTVNETEPEVLYTGMHHAREPIGMQQMLFYMYYLLENYDSDPDIQYLVNNTEMYFVPVVNPDGYARNIYTNPNGGGSWRKNRRNNGNGTYGVDPNRNYGFAWGYDNSGSSPDPGDETYRGPSAFSEPENDNLRDFCEAHEFRLALNYHSYAGLLLYAWGYIPDPSPDDELMHDYGAIMTQENAYTYGPGNTTIYATNGGSDDWMYGEQTTKGKIFAFTPEMGNGDDGFWPTPSRIIPLCQLSMWQNIMLARLAGPYAEIKDLSSAIVEEMSGYFGFNIKRLGLDETGVYTVSIQPLNDAITSVGAPIVYDALGLMESIDDSLSYTLKEDIKSGDQILYLLSVDNGYYVTSDTVSKIFGAPVVIFEDDGNTFTKWTSSKWANTPLAYHSPDKSITDSPSGDYNNYETNIMTLNESIDLSNAVFAVLNFWAKWEIEPGYDYVEVLVSLNGQTWTPLAGKYTRTGTEYQDPGEPVFDGTQSTWVNEEMSLEPFLGEQIYLRFKLAADSYVTGDGFYWDDMTVTIIDLYTGLDKPLEGSTFKLNGPLPNPAEGKTRFSYSFDSSSDNLSLSVFNCAGQKMYEQNLASSGNLVLSVSGWGSGIYFYQFKADGIIQKSGKMIVR
jgi:hypothetical protein